MKWLGLLFNNKQQPHHTDACIQQTAKNLKSEHDLQIAFVMGVDKQGEGYVGIAGTGGPRSMGSVANTLEQLATEMRKDLLSQGIPDEPCLIENLGSSVTFFKATKD